MTRAEIVCAYRSALHQLRWEWDHAASCDGEDCAQQDRRERGALCKLLAALREVYDVMGRRDA